MPIDLQHIQIVFVPFEEVDACLIKDHLLFLKRELVSFHLLVSVLLCILI